MQALSVAPNAETYELLLDAQGAAGHVEAMRRSLGAVAAAGLRLSPAGWSGVMGHFGACGDLEVGACAGGVGVYGQMGYFGACGDLEVGAWAGGAGVHGQLGLGVYGQMGHSGACGDL